MAKLLNLLKYWLGIVPKWDRCAHASCWDGMNAQRRMMNILSPKFDDAKFKEYVHWMEGRGCDTAHVILMNGADGEGSGYTALDNPKLTEKRVKYLRKRGFAVVPWIITDDSRAYAKQLFADPERYVKAFAAIGLFKEASFVVLGLEMDEYGTAAQWASVKAALQAYAPKLKTGVHHTGGKYVFAGLGDIVLDQLEPPKATPATVAASIGRIRAMGKAAVGFEYSRHPDRALAQAALDAGAFGVGNW